MTNLTKEDDKIVEALFQRLFTNAAPLNVGGYARVNKLELSVSKVKYLEDYLWESGLTDKVIASGDVRFLLKLNHKGNVLLTQHGSYSKYIKYLKKQVREPWPKRYWLAACVIAYVFGILSPIIGKLIEEKILPESTRSVQPIQAVTDTVKKIH